MTQRELPSPGPLTMTDEIPVETATLAAETDPPKEAHLRRHVLSGSAIMLVSSAFVGGMNLIYNFVVAHRLGADQFGHASVVYTLLMLLSSITLTFQLVCSKFVARSSSATDKIKIYHLLHRWAWVAGILVGTLIALASGVITGYLNLPAKSLIVLLAAAAMFYVPLGVRRGFMQGTYDFRPLALNFSLEVIVKLAGAVALIGNYGVEGVVGAMSASVLVAYFVGIPRKHHITAGPGPRLQSGALEGLQAATFFVGQVIINNLDIVLVKHFFDSTQAGVYAAVALVGRVVYMLSWSVVSSMFPFSAGARSEKGSRAVLSVALLLVAGIATLFTLGAWLAPAGLWHTLLGSGFPVGKAHFYSGLLVLYALTTAIYSIAVVLMTYEISQKIGNVSWVQLGFSGAIIAGIYLFHSTLHQVVAVQLVLMLALVLVVSIPFVRARPSDTLLAENMAGGLRKIRRVSEDEVIAEFLQGEFYQDEFSRFRDKFAMLVSDPDFSDASANALRRALLFRRRGRLWRELPEDTEWWEVELATDDLGRVRVFARNHWLRYGAPGFSLLDTVEKVRERIASRSRDPFIQKLRSLSLELVQDTSYTSIILITMNEATPLTIIEGNHRMTAAALVSPETLHRRFRYICGFSPKMYECCWYRTDASTLWKYLLNTIAYYLFDRQKVAATILEASTSKQWGNNAASSVR
jgi:O-antigen/teichoic acid export membrane protein